MTLPLVTVLIPARNEEADIERCLSAVLVQDYPVDRLEVVVVVGASEDRTAAVSDHVLRQSAIRSKVVTLDHGATPTNLNEGLRVASGSIICRVDARSLIPRNYVSACVEVLGDPAVVVVGGRQHARARAGAQFVARSIARGLNNRWSTGLARYRRGGRSGPTDTVYLGAMRSGDLREVGGWDIRFATNQDFELNRRLGARGVVWYDDRLVVDYLPRERWSELWRQYVRFGRWKVTYWRLSGSRPEPRQFLLLLAPVAAATGVVVLWRRSPLVAIGGLAVTAAVVDLTGVSESGTLPERSGGLLAAALSSGGWWYGVTTGLVRSR